MAAARYEHPELALLYHIPNGGKRGKIEAARLKGMGVKPGVPDYHLPVARGGYHGVWIELKAPRGRTSEEQRQWITDLRTQGHLAEVCVGWIEAKHVLQRYLSQ